MIGVFGRQTSLEGFHPDSVSLSLTTMLAYFADAQPRSNHTSLPYKVNLLNYHIVLIGPHLDSRLCFQLLWTFNLTLTTHTTRS